MNFEAKVPETVAHHTFWNFNVIKYEGECQFN